MESNVGGGSRSASPSPSPTAGNIAGDTLTPGGGHIKNGSSNISLKNMNISQFPMSLIIEANDNTKIKINIDREIIDNRDINIDNDEKDNNYKIGDLICLTKNRRGIIKYIGDVIYDTGTFYGVELIGESNGRGYHNGTVKNHTYFKCGPKNGIFINEQQIVRKMKRIDFENDLKQIEINRSAHKKSKSSKGTTVNNKNSKKEEIQPIKKLGPRDIGRIKGWRPSREIYDKETDNEYKKLRKQYKKHGRKKRSSMVDLKELEKLRNKKLGPRDIGRIHNSSNWKPIEGYKKKKTENKDESKKKESNLLNVKREKTPRRHSAALYERKAEYEKKKKLKQKSRQRGMTISKTPKSTKSGLTKDYSVIKSITPEPIIILNDSQSLNTKKKRKYGSRSRDRANSKHKRKDSKKKHKKNVGSDITKKPPVIKQSSLEIVVDDHDNMDENGDGVDTFDEDADAFVFKTFGIKSSNRSFRSRSEIVGAKKDDYYFDMDEDDNKNDESKQNGNLLSPSTTSNVNHDKEISAEVKKEMNAHSADMSSIRQQLWAMEQESTNFNKSVNKNLKNKLSIKTSDNDELDEAIEQAKATTPLFNIQIDYDFDNNNNNNKSNDDDDDESSVDPTLIIHD